MKLALAVLAIAMASPGVVVAMPATHARAGVSDAASPVETVATRRCWYRGGTRHCRYVGRPRVYGYRDSQYRSTDPKDYRTGSRGWWEAKEREGSAGNPP